MEAGQETATCIDISIALQIDGWMSPPELIWLAEQASKHMRILEIGSHLGRSTSALALNTEGHVWAFDDWYGPRDVAQIWDSDLLFESFLNNTKGLPVTALKGNHADIDSLLGEFHFDMIFIDGSHEYKDVKRDIQAAKEHSDGLICGHDYWLEDVRKAVSEEFDSVKVAESIWYKER